MSIGSEELISPSFHCAKPVPESRGDMHTEPGEHLIPNTDREPALKKEVSRRFLYLLAQRATVAVWPSSALKPVRGPNPILIDKPGEEFAFRRGPSLPNR